MSKYIFSQTTIFNRSTVLLMTLVCVISLLAVAGYVVNQPLLSAYFPEFIPMASAAALLFLGVCAAWALPRFFPGQGWIRLLVQAALLAMFILCFIFAIRYLTGYSQEQLVSPIPALIRQILFTRMSPLTALGFELVIPALLLLTGNKPGLREKTTAAILSLVVMLLSAINCLGYLFNAPLFYGGTVIPVALSSAFAFLFLSTGLLLTAGPECWPLRIFIGPSYQARMLRTFIPVLFLIVLLQGFFSSVDDLRDLSPALGDAISALLAWAIGILMIAQSSRKLTKEIEHIGAARISVEKSLQQSEARYRTLVETANDAIITVDHHGLIVFWNKAAETIFGYSGGEMDGQSVDRIIPEGFRADQHEGPPKVVLTEASHSIGTTVEVTGRRKDGQTFPIALSLASWQHSGEFFITGIAHDISKRKRADAVQSAIFKITQAALTGEGIDTLYQAIHSILGELIPAKNFFIALYDSANGLISFPYYIDQYDAPPSLPTLLEGLTGYVIRTGRPLLADRETYDRLVLQGEVEKLGTESVDWLGAPLKAEERIIGVICVQSYTQGTHYSQADLDLLEFVSSQVAQAIERRRMEEEIRNLSFMDELTGLYNRRGFNLLADQEMKLAHRTNRTLLLFFGDVNNLKKINDTYGHAQGDLALREISAILKKCFREADILARIGGDEFVALALDVSSEDAQLITNRIRSALELGPKKGDISYPLSLSLGVAAYNPEVPITVSELIAEADAHMYQQKQADKMAGKLPR